MKLCEDSICIRQPTGKGHKGTPYRGVTNEANQTQAFECRSQFSGDSDGQMTASASAFVSEHGHCLTCYWARRPHSLTSVRMAFRRLFPGLLHEMPITHMELKLEETSLRMKRLACPSKPDLTQNHSMEFCLVGAFCCCWWWWC